MPEQDLREDLLKSWREYQESDQWLASDRVVGKAFRAHPYNTNFDEVLLKTAVLKALYHTHAPQAHPIARRIVEGNLDNLLDTCQIESAVSLIRGPWDKGKKGAYSHATKYCHWHRPDQFPMYDKNVSKALVVLSRELGLNSIRDKDLLEFGSLKETVDKVRRELQLTDWSYKRMDEGLWIYGARLLA